MGVIGNYDLKNNVNVYHLQEYIWAGAYLCTNNAATQECQIGNFQALDMYLC